jgi:hypothetical protein
MYDHEQHIKDIIATLKEDDYLIEKSEYREAREKAISALQEAYNALRQAEKEGA